MKTERQPSVTTRSCKVHRTGDQGVCARCGWLVPESMNWGEQTMVMGDEQGVSGKQRVDSEKGVDPTKMFEDGAPGLPSDRAQRVFGSRTIDGKHGTHHLNTVKFIAGHLWDSINDIPVYPGDSDTGRLVSLAKTELENTVMWAVKAISRGYEKTEEAKPDTSGPSDTDCFGHYQRP